MKKNLLLLVGLSFISILGMGQNNDKILKSDKISEFKNRMYLSNSKDPMATLKAKSIKAKELAAQELVKPQVLEKSSLKAGNSGQALIDTTHSYPWNATTQQWDTVPFARMISYYDSLHNLVHYIAYTRNPDTRNWQDSVQVFYKYNTSNQVLEFIQQSWQFDGYSNYNWGNVERHVYEYNALGQESKFTFQNWDNNSKSWNYVWQHELTYDSIGNNTLILETWWDSGASRWTPGINYINKLDKQNHLVLNLMQSWNNSTWADVFQYKYGYDVLGNNKSVLLQTWNPDGNSWDNSQLKTINYSNSKIDNYLLQLWDPFLFNWTNLQRGLYKYDSIGNNTCILGEDYDPNSNTWNTSWVNYYDYNAQNKQISNASLYWDAGLGNWAYGSKTKSFKINLSQLDAKKSIATLEVYPNPANELVYIQNNSAINQVKVFDMMGNEMLLKNYNGLNSIQLDISNFKPGVYFLIIKDSTGVSTTKKLVKR